VFTFLTACYRYHHKAVFHLFFLCQVHSLSLSLPPVLYS